MPTKNKFLFLALLFCLCAAGCARPYAAHLPHTPWTPGVTQHVSTKTLDFTYEAVTNRNLQGIIGYSLVIRGEDPNSAKIIRQEEAGF